MIRAAISFWQPIASIVASAPARSSNSSSRGMAVISFDLSSTATWPRVTWLAPAQALTRCSGASPRPRRPRRRAFLPSIGTRRRDPGGEAALERLGVQQAEDAAEGVMRGDAVGQAEVLGEPVVLGPAVRLHRRPGLGTRDDGARWRCR